MSLREWLRPLTQTKTVLGDGELTMDAWGRAKVINDFSLIHGLFTYDIPYQIWVLQENGTELLDISASTRTSSINGELVLKSGGTLNDVSQLHTKRHPRYQPNRGHLWSASIFLPGKTLLGERNFGLFNDENGVFFRLKSDGKLYAVLKSNNVETIEEEIKHLPETFDAEKGNTYDIQMQWRGVGDIYFFVGDPATGRSKLVHSFNLLGTQDAIIIANPALSASFEAINNGNEVTIKCGCVDVTSEGGNQVREQFATHQSNEVAVTDDVIFGLRVPLLFNGKTNTRDLRRARLSVSSDKKGTFSIYAGRNPTALTINVGAWVAHNGGNVEVFTPVLSTDSSLDRAKVNLIIKRSIQAGTNEYVTNPEPLHIDAFLSAGDYFFVTGTGSGASAVMSCTFEWGEEI